MNARHTMALVGTLLLGAALVSGCAGPQRRPGGGDPDRASGPDREMAGATLRPFEQPATDTVSYHRGDRTDWHAFDVVDFGGRLAVKLTWVDVKSEVDLGIYDDQGEQLLLAPQTPGQEKSVELSPIEPGRYFVRVQAVEKGDDTSYTITGVWSFIESTPANIEPTELGQPAKEIKEGKRPRGELVPVHIVSAQQDGKAFIVHLDKGSAAGVKVGSTGALLQGSGNTTVPGTSFRVIKVVDENRSIAKASRPFTAKSNRAALWITR